MSASKQTSIQARNKEGSEFALRQTASDSPLLPVSSLERLHSFRPDIVDWILEETREEAKNRREEQHRVNTFEFIQRLISQIFALFIAAAGIGGGIYAAIIGFSTLGIVIASGTLVTLAVAFLRYSRRPASE